MYIHVYMYDHIIHTDLYIKNESFHIYTYISIHIYIYIYIYIGTYIYVKIQTYIYINT
jgi:hypothetical protein